MAVTRRRQVCANRRKKIVKDRRKKIVERRHVFYKFCNDDNKTFSWMI